jgi:Uma2 family endonuclease
MAMQARERSTGPTPLFEVGGRRYLEAPVPVHFPEQEPLEEKVPETPTHQSQREVLRDSARTALAQGALIASDQFLYWDPTDPRRSLAPDLAIRRGARPERTPTWKVWERGAPDLCVEIVSESDRPPSAWDAKLGRYRCCGVRELVRFDPDDSERPFRIWDQVDGDLVERALEGPRAESLVLGLWWVVRRDDTGCPLMRLGRDPEGLDLVPTALERETEARRAAEARVAELEAELRRR